MGCVGACMRVKQFLAECKKAVFFYKIVTFLKKKTKLSLPFLPFRINKLLRVYYVAVALMITVSVNKYYQKQNVPGTTLP
jgi:hypothetical protein